MGTRHLAAASLIMATAKATATATPPVSSYFLFPVTGPVIKANRATPEEGCPLRSVSSPLLRPKGWQVFRSPEAGAGSTHLGQI